MLNGLRISEALGADVRDYGHDRGHRVLRVVRKGGKAARTPLAPPVVRALDAYLDGRTSGPLFLAADGTSRYPYQSAFSQIRRLARAAGIPAADRITPTACGTPSPPKPSPSAPPCKTSKTPSATPTPAPPAATTATGTTSTAPPPTCSPAL